jgi:hypothetical protein
MSNVPMGGDLPSNSHKSQEQQQQKDNRPAIPEFNGEVAGVKRKQKGGSFLRWLRKMFLSDQKPSDIMKQVIEQQIVPGIKDNFRNSLVSSVDMFIYQSAKPSSTTSNNVAYGKIFKSGQNAAPANTQSAQQANPKSTDLDKGFTNPCFRFLDTRMDANGNRVQGAKDFLQMMKDYDYPTLSVHTLYMMRKQRIDYTWDAYGWTREEIQNVQIVHINNPDYPWMIDLPSAHVIS